MCVCRTTNDDHIVLVGSGHHHLVGHFGRSVGRSWNTVNEFTSLSLSPSLPLFHSNSLSINSIVLYRHIRFTQATFGRHKWQPPTFVRHLNHFALWRWPVCSLQPIIFSLLVGPGRVVGYKWIIQLDSFSPFSCNVVMVSLIYPSVYQNSRLSYIMVTISKNDDIYFISRL